ncbi:MAG: exodeoxyribonuclease V subunit gamma [Pseudomonadota bacterium]
MKRRLTIHIGNKLETLAAALAQTLDTPLPSPLDSEIVVVQSKGMERWLSMELARFHGVCANVTFPFPKTIVNQLFDALIPGLPEQSPYEPEIMTWKIMKLLPGLVGEKGFESLGNYLGPGGDMLRLYQLSDKIANVFDQYLVYRPGMLLEWERGKGKGGEWQAALWRKLVSDCGAPHSARLKDEFLAALKKAAEPPPDFPTRLSVFGISSLPPFHMEVLAAIAGFCEVNLFLMSPVRRSWSVKANSLVGSMGTLGREFFEQVGSFKAAVNEKFEEPAGDGIDSMLRLVQSDIFNNRERGGGAPAPSAATAAVAAAVASQQKTTIRKNDGSIQVHSCYSPMREIEVLHDNLLAMFDEDKNLEPGDVVVMTPEIETYAPFIQAVFDNPEDESTRIRFSIADRSAAKESPLIDALLDIISLHQSRLGAGRVVSILESRAVQQKFGLQDDDVDLIRRWIVSTAIRWGKDAEGRRKLGLPPTPENTWMAGLDRLLLGYALPGKGSRMFEGILPYDDIEGGDALVLGNFMEFAQKLFAAVDDFGKTRTLGQWSELLAQTLESFFEPDEDSEREVRLVRRTIARLADIQDRSGFGEKVGIDAISSYLGSALQRAQFGMGFLTGGVTFCAMLPMRSIPFKVVCLVGMNDAFYPRRPKALGFDLMARDPKPCDRSPRDDDRYLFLEALLSARRKLYISYTGRSIRDNTAIPPSVVVSELLDYLRQAFELEPDGKGPQKEKSAAGQIVTLHRLQAFSQGYFNNETGLFSYSRDNCDAARRAMAKRAGPETFIRAGAGLPPIGEEWKTLDVGRLGEFLVNPSRYLLQGRLGIRLDEGEAELDEREPFDVAGLEKYVLDKDLVEKRLAGQDMEEFMAVVRASGRLPHGNMGRCMYERLVNGVDAFIEQLWPFIQDALLDPVNLDLRVADFRLTGRIDGIFEKGLVRFRCATVKTKDMLRMWVRHLALCALKPKKSLPTSLLVGSDVIHELRPVEDAANVLADLLEKYYEGMSAPLPFFPDSSWEFASAMLRGDPPDSALEAATDMWEGGFKRDGEGRDVYFDLCFGKVNPFDEAFEEAAMEIYEPLITSMEAG